jgi:hypothetical protein
LKRRDRTGLEEAAGEILKNGISPALGNTALGYSCCGTLEGIRTQNITAKDAKDARVKRK